MDITDSAAGSRQRVVGFADVVRIPLRRWRLVLASTAVLLVLVLVYLFVLPAKYTATAVVVLRPVVTDPFSAPSGNSDKLVNMNAENGIALGNDVIDSTAKTLKRDAEEVRNALSTEVPTGGQVLRFQFADDDEDDAIAGANTAAETYLRVRKDIYKQQQAQQTLSYDDTIKQVTAQRQAAQKQLSSENKDDQSSAGTQAILNQISALNDQIAQLANARAKLASADLTPGSITAAARAPVPSSHDAAPLMLAGAVLGGLLLGMVLAHARESMDRRVRSAGQVTDLTGVPALGSVRAVAKGQEDAAAADARYVSIAVLKAVDGRTDRPLVVLSARADEGRTAVTSNLAVALAEAGHDVTLAAPAETQEEVKRILFGAQRRTPPRPRAKGPGHAAAANPGVSPGTAAAQSYHTAPGGQGFTGAARPGVHPASGVPGAQGAGGSPVSSRTGGAGVTAGGHGAGPNGAGTNGTVNGGTQGPTLMLPTQGGRPGVAPTSGPGVPPASGQRPGAGQQPGSGQQPGVGQQPGSGAPASGQPAGRAGAVPGQRTGPGTPPGGVNVNSSAATIPLTDAMRQAAGLGGSGRIPRQPQGPGSGHASRQGQQGQNQQGQRPGQQGHGQGSGQQGQRPGQQGQGSGGPAAGFGGSEHIVPGFGGGEHIVPGPVGGDSRRMTRQSLGLGGSGDVAPGQVSGAHLAPGQVSGGYLAAGQVSGGYLASGQLPGGYPGPVSGAGGGIREHAGPGAPLVVLIGGGVVRLCPLGEQPLSGLVVVDAPPSDTDERGVRAAQTGVAVLVVARDKTRHDELTRLTDRLRSSGAQTVGFVLTGGHGA
jgi:capsular polysaccharide biosynthesis protein